MAHLGDFDAAAVIYGKFSTFRPSTGATFTLGGTPALSVYKDNSVTQSTTGVTLTADFDSVTGLNHFAIDTSADGTFYAAGSFFDIVITTGTVDSVSVTGSVVGSFTLRKNSALKPTTAGRALDVSAGGEAGLDWANIGSPTTAQNLSATNVDVDQIVASVSGAVGSVTGLTAATVHSDLDDIQARLPAALVSGRIDASVGAMAANVLTATAINADAITAAKIADGAIDAATFAANAITATVIAADAITAAKIADGAIDAATFAANAITATAIAADAITDAKVAADVTIASVTGAVGSVTGAVGSVTGAVGSVTGAVGSVTGNVGGNVTGTIGGLTAAALKDFFDTDSATTYASAVAGSVVKEIADNAGGSALSEAGIADAVWDEARAGHVGAGSFGEGVASVQGNVTGSVGSVTGAVGSVTGNVGGNVAGSVASVTGLTASNLDATVSSRLATAGYTAPPTVAQILTTAITEAYRANGAAPTLAQFISEVLAHLGESSISGTTKTINKLDHSTAAETFTLDSAVTPASITRAT